MENLNKEQIKKLLPHREPMLLIDELYDIKKLTSATAVVNVKKDSFFVQGHFPDNPVIQNYMNENSVQILLNSKNIFMGKKEIDLTQQLIDEINKQVKQ